MVKALTLVILLGFAGWAAVRFGKNLILRAQGRPRPQPQGLRPITLVALLLLLLYGGYVAWYLITS